MIIDEFIDLLSQSSSHAYQSYALFLSKSLQVLVYDQTEKAYLLNGHSPSGRKKFWGYAPFQLVLVLEALEGPIIGQEEESLCKLIE